MFTTFVCLLNIVTEDYFYYLHRYFCLRPKAKDLGITRVVVVVLGFFV